MKPPMASNLPPNTFMVLTLNKNNKGFTLLEAILAVFVTAVGVLGAYGLTQQILAYSSLSNSNFTAAYLAKEGIEIVRNIRDSNWVNDRTWNFGLDVDGDYQVNYDGQSLSPYTDGSLSFISGSQTKYKRKITIETLADGSLRVSSEVFWSEKGQTKSINAQDILYEWWQ